MYAQAYFAYDSKKLIDGFLNSIAYGAHGHDNLFRVQHDSRGHYLL